MAVKVDGINALDEPLHAIESDFNSNWLKF